MLKQPSEPSLPLYPVLPALYLGLDAPHSGLDTHGHLLTGLPEPTLVFFSTVSMGSVPKPVESLKLLATFHDLQSDTCSSTVVPNPQPQCPRPSRFLSDPLHPPAWQVLSFFLAVLHSLWES